MNKDQAPREVGSPSSDKSGALGFSLKRILVPTDFSDASRQALPYAVEFAKQFGAKLTLVHVFPTTLSAELSRIGIVLEQKRLVQEAGVQLERFRERELPANLSVETLLLHGAPAHEITKLAKDSQTDLIITATHGHTGLKHVWLGSTAERIVHQAPCPVLVVREQPVPVRFPNSALCRFRHILVPTDFSDAAGKALRYAEAFARPCGSEVTILHVIEPPPYPEFGYAHLPLKERKLKKVVQDKLDVLTRELADAGVKSSSAIRTGSAFHEIAEQASGQCADLIIVATRGRGTLAHALLGSTAERVVRHAPCPVLVVRERERQFVTA